MSAARILAAISSLTAGAFSSFRRCRPILTMSLSLRMVLGFSIVARIPKAAAVALTFLVWLLILGATVLPMLLPSLLSR